MGERTERQAWKRNVFIFIGGLTWTCLTGLSTAGMQLWFETTTWKDYGVNTPHIIWSFFSGATPVALRYFIRHWRMLFPSSWQDEIDEAVQLGSNGSAATVQPPVNPTQGK